MIEKKVPIFSDEDSKAQVVVKSMKRVCAYLVDVIVDIPS